ncbi:MAG: hypothetical protein JXR83_20630, partial [Deltaproteobacteria bacterium]|nr:hypothetical protein [Deltaproteobacteria bacterium]
MAPLLIDNTLTFTSSDDIERVLTEVRELGGLSLRCQGQLPNTGPFALHLAVGARVEPTAHPTQVLSVKGDQVTLLLKSAEQFAAALAALL